VVHPYRGGRRARSLSNDDAPERHRTGASSVQLHRAASARDRDRTNARRLSLPGESMTTRLALNVAVAGALGQFVAIVNYLAAHEKRPSLLILPAEMDVE